MTNQVRTSAGAVEGSWEDGVAVFRGIPFAAADRFAAPASAVSWDGVRDATRFGPPPPQPGRATEGSDWLNLAVWTPDPGAARLPVFVWISGGAYLTCNSANPHLTGTAIAEAGAVMVSAHYRTGAEGFARIEGASDNRGLLDQVAALQWTRENIKAFGGDPDNITVLGQSAGAGSIAALLAMPRAAGLFRRAILQSLPGTFLAPALAADIAEQICAELGRAPRRADLVDIAPDALVAAARTVTGRLPEQEGRWGAVALTPTPFSPVVDGEILPEPPWAALAGGAARDLEIVVGHTRDEVKTMVAQLAAADDAAVDHLLGVLDPSPGVQRYRMAFPSASPDELRETALSDWLIRMSSVHLAEAAHAGGAKVWLYELCWGYDAAGASHGLDTRLLFGTAHINTELDAAGPAAIAEADHLAALLRAEHLAFAATGNPGWDRYRPAGRATRVYDAEPAVVPYPGERSRRIWTDQRFHALDRTG